MNTQFRHMQKLAFGNSLPINENEFKNKIRELVYSSLDERKKKIENLTNEIKSVELKTEELKKQKPKDIEKF